MKTNIAVATVSGRAYYRLVSELKRKKIAFLPIRPDEEVPLNVKVIITTKLEKSKVRFPTVLIYDENTDPSIIIEEALEIIRGKHRYNNLVVGIDPGKDCGLAAVGDGEVLQTESASNEEAALKVLKIMETFKGDRKTVKIGNGADIYRTNLIKILDKMLPQEINMESVEERGTTRNIDMISSRRSSRDTSSAIKISLRRGQKIMRKGQISDYQREEQSL